MQELRFSLTECCKLGCLYFTSLVALWQFRDRKLRRRQWCSCSVWTCFWSISSICGLRSLRILKNITPAFAIGSFANKQIVRLQETPDAIPEGETPHTVSLCLYNTMVDAAKPGDRVEVWDLCFILHEIYHCRILDLHWPSLLCIVLRIFVITSTFSRNASNLYLFSK